MSALGGLSLSLQAANRQDRRTRFVTVQVWSSAAKKPVALVTDARGRMRYRLPDGSYRLSVDGAPSTVFEVRDHRWTFVRAKLS